MSDLPQEFDLKFLPDWLKESPAQNRYADYEGDTGDRPRRGRDEGRGPGGRAGRGPGGRSGPPRDDGQQRGPRPNRPAGDKNRGPQPGGNRAREGRPPDRHAPFEGNREASRPAPTVLTAALRIEFLPEPNAAAGIARQIKSSGRAYALFGTSKMFMDRPERHSVRVTSADPAVPLFQIGTGPISFDRVLVERSAFSHERDHYYAEEKVEGEPIKGNFTNVALCRSTGTLLGPTNHHSYQSALRKLYEERFSRRMPFGEFQQREIETVTNEQAVADWKEQARSTITYTTTQEAEPVVLKTLAEAEQHFRKHYLPQLVKSGVTLECSGQASRAAMDRHVAGAVREAWEAESRFPQQIVNGLRPFLMEAGLHFFKHRKRVLFVSATKPVRHPAQQNFSDGIAAILRAVEAKPRIKRPELATQILGAADESIEGLARKAQLAADLHYLTRIGHVIEFADGGLDLPLAPQEKPTPSHPSASAPKSADSPAPENTPELAQTPEEAGLETPLTETPESLAAPEAAPAQDLQGEAANRETASPEENRVDTSHDESVPSPAPHTAEHTAIPQPAAAISPA